MFAQKVQSIESQILQLTEQLNQYRSLETELEQALGAIARIKSTAAELGVSGEVEASLGLSTDGWQEEREAFKDKLKNRDLRIERLEKAYNDVASERDQQLTAIRELEQKLENQQVSGWVNLVEPDEEWGVEESQAEQEITEAEARASIFPEPIQLGLPCIEIDSLVQTPDGQVGRVIYLKNDLATVKLPQGPGNFHRDHLRYVGKHKLQPVEQILKSKTWNEMRDIVLENPELLTEAIKQEPAFMTSLPTQIATYVNATRKVEDLDKLPRMLAESVRVLLTRFEQKETVAASDVSYGKIQEVAQNLYSFKTWAQIRAVMQGFAPATKSEILKEMAKTANNKTKTKFIENLPSMISKYCEKGDRTDLDWLPGVVVTKVEELLGQAAA